RRALLLPERRVLQRLQRRQPAARFLRVLAHFGQFVLRGALLVLQFDRGLLALLEIGGQRVERGCLLVVPALHAGEGFGERSEVQRRALGVELFATAVGIQRLPVEVVDAGALDVAGARGFVLFAAVRVPALLPVGQRFLGGAQRVLAL